MKNYCFSILFLCISSFAFAQNKVVTGTILLNNKVAPDAKILLNNLKGAWKLRTDSANVSDKTVVFSTGTETVMIAWLDYPAPAAEVQAAARLSWLWKNAKQEAALHQSQVVISVIGSEKKAVELYKIFTKTAAAVLENTQSSGVFMNSQYLILSKDFYLAAARNTLNDKALPMYCWVYFGMMDEENQKSSGYTYGLREFGLEELEIEHANGTTADTHAVLFDVATSIVLYNTQLKENQVFTTIEGLKVTVRKGKAAFVDGETFKLQY
jgi:Domain of unknown function (DUF4261)